MIEGHDNYWEQKIEAIKKLIDDFEEIKPTSTVTQLLELERHIKEILEED